MSIERGSYEFTLVLTGFSELEPEAMDSLYEAGCDDGLLCLDKRGVPFIEFEREASTFDEAVRSAIENVHKTTFRVVRVEADPSRNVESINAELAAVRSGVD